LRNTMSFFVTVPVLSENTSVICPSSSLRSIVWTLSRAGSLMPATEYTKPLQTSDTNTTTAATR
jgi:hypothetical protein